MTGRTVLSWKSIDRWSDGLFCRGISPTWPVGRISLPPIPLGYATARLGCAASKRPANNPKKPKSVAPLKDSRRRRRMMTNPHRKPTVRSIRPKTVAAAAASGSEAELLMAMRDTIARTITDGGPARDLSSLSRRLLEISRELGALQARRGAGNADQAAGYARPAARRRAVARRGLGVSRAGGVFSFPPGWPASGRPGVVHPATVNATGPSGGAQHQIRCVKSDFVFTALRALPILLLDVLLNRI